MVVPATTTRQRSPSSAVNPSSSSSRRCASSEAVNMFARRPVRGGGGSPPPYDMGPAQPHNEGIWHTSKRLLLPSDRATPADNRPQCRAPRKGSGSRDAAGDWRADLARAVAAKRDRELADKRQLRDHCQRRAHEDSRAAQCEADQKARQKLAWAAELAVQLQQKKDRTAVTPRATTTRPSEGGAHPAPHPLQFQAVDFRGQPRPAEKKKTLKPPETHLEHTAAPLMAPTSPCATNRRRHLPPSPGNEWYGCARPRLPGQGSPAARDPPHAVSRCHVRTVSAAPFDTTFANPLYPSTEALGERNKFAHPVKRRCSHTQDQRFESRQKIESCEFAAPRHSHRQPQRPSTAASPIACGRRSLSTDTARSTRPW